MKYENNRFAASQKGEAAHWVNPFIIIRVISSGNSDWGFIFVALL